MRSQLWSICRRPALMVCLALLSRGQAATAQDRIIIQDVPPSTPHVVVNATTAALEAPISPATSPGPMSLDACIDLGFQYQPALDAARASLAAARSGQQGLNKMIIPRLFTPDLGVRRQQACHGVAIAEAGLTQAEWDTRYAVTRNFFTVQYIRSQQVVVDDVLKSLNDGYARAKKIFDAGDPNSKITQIDLDALQIQVALVKGKKSQAENGMLKALAALREAMGVRHDYPLEIAATDLPPTNYTFNKDELIASALANRGEMAQATSAHRVTALEIQAQTRIFGWQGRTFAAGADIHTVPIPQGIFNNEYRPGAIGLEMPGMLAGHKSDRVQRATDLDQRAAAVVDKTTNLVSLDVEAQYLKWQEALNEVQYLRGIYKTAQNLPAQVEKLLQGKDLTGIAIIQANSTAIQIRTSLNDALHIHALALAGLERATAGGFRIYPAPAKK